MIHRCMIAAAALTLGGCAPKLHLQYDFGRAYVETLRMQSDLTRPSAQAENYTLYGIEGMMIRQNAEKLSTDEESAESQFSN